MLKAPFVPFAGARAPTTQPVQSSSSLIIALLYLSYLLSFADRIIFGMSLNGIKSTLGFTDSQLGLLSGAAFAVSYAVFSPVGGWMVDRWRRQAIMPSAIALFSLMTLLTGLAGSFWSMAAARIGVGVGESFISPLAVSLISDTVPRQRRARKFGLYLSAGALGSICALLLGGLVVHAMGRSDGLYLPLLGRLKAWQGLFVASALPGFALAVAVIALLREPSRVAGVAAEFDVHGFEDVRSFIRRYWLLIIAIFVGIPMLQLAAYTYGTWAVVFFERAHGWSPVRSALVLGGTTGISTLVGCLACGRIIDALRRRGYVDAPLRVGTAAGLIFAVFGTAGVLVSDATLAVAILCVATFTAYMPAVTIYASMGDIIPAATRGRFAAIHTLAIGIISNAIGPLLVGVFNDRLFVGADGIRFSLAVTFLVTTIVGVATVLPGLSLYRRRMGELTI